MPLQRLHPGHLEDRYAKGGEEEAGSYRQDKINKHLPHCLTFYDPPPSPLFFPTPCDLSFSLITYLFPNTPTTVAHSADKYDRAHTLTDTLLLTYSHFLLLFSHTHTCTAEFILISAAGGQSRTQLSLIKQVQQRVLIKKS